MTHAAFSCCLLFALLALSASPSRAQLGSLDRLADIEDALGSFELLTEPGLLALRQSESIESVCSDTTLKRIHSTLAAYRQVLSEEQKLNAKASFSFRDNRADGRNGEGDETRSPEKQAIVTSTTISRGRYPIEVDFRSSVALSRTENGTIVEDISTLFFSVDRNINSDRFEAYAFLDRTTDGFLNIDQRYESGAGAMYNLRFGRTAKGAALDDRLEYGQQPTPTDSSYVWQGEGGWSRCYQAVRQALGGDSSDLPLLSTVRSQLEQASAVARRSVQEEYATVRLAVLAGLQGEIEQASLGAYEQSDRGLRIVVRPTISLQPLDGIQMRADWYLVYGVSGFMDPPEPFEDRIVREIDGVSWLGRDVRTELNLTLRMQVRGVELVARHERIRDSIPPFAVVDGQVITDADGAPVVAAWKRNLTSLAVAIPL